MSSEVEFEGRTIAQAEKKACQQLDIKQENLKYTVISKGSTGIFGIVGAKKALIKVILPEKQIDNDGVHQKKDAFSEGRELREETSAGVTPAAQAGHEALERMIAGITDGARVMVKEGGNRISYDIIVGGQAGVLIGKRGQTLEAMQYLVEKVVNRKSKERLRISIDVAGYLARKRQKLENLAARTAQKAKKNGKTATIGQLNAHDRRIVHLCLKNDEDVVTKSVGKGLLRKLVVMPKRRSPGHQNRP
jgi:spoIIIJ-associated protein